MDSAVEFLHYILQDQIKAVAVTGIEKDRFTCVAAEKDMVDCAWIMDAEFACQEGRLSENGRKTNPTPFFLFVFFVRCNDLQFRLDWISYEGMQGPLAEIVGKVG